MLGENWTNLLLVVTGILIASLGWMVGRNTHRIKRLRVECFNRVDQLSDVYEQKLTTTRHEAQEAALLSVAREIHDNFNMRLIVASMNLRHIDWNDPQQTKTKVLDSLEQLSESIQGLTDMSRSLNTDLVLSLGLTGALRKEIERICRAGNFHVHFDVNGEPEFLPEIVEISVFRLFQECFNNIIKHSGTNLVQVSLTYLSHTMYLMIIDHGVGFDEEAAAGGGSGFANLQSRVKSINGQMKIKTTIGEGTSFLFTIPYPNANSPLCLP